VRRETPGTWEHQKAVQEEANRRAREADDEHLGLGISLCLSTEIL
jgi:hypothetical protein